MKKLVNQVRSKPEPTRRKVALGISISLTLVIAVVWVTTFPYQFDEESKAEVVASNVKQSAAALPPFQTLIKSLGDSAAHARNTIFNGVDEDQGEEITEEPVEKLGVTPTKKLKVELGQPAELDFLPSQGPNFLPDKNEANMVKLQPAEASI